MKFTVLGASGFIGSNLVAHLRREGHECLVPSRGDPAVFGEDLGHVFYCIGLTADFRQRPFDTVRAHVCLLADILEKSRFESLLYLSSTRIYGNAESTREDSKLLADPQNPSDLYNLTKMTGESLCFASGRTNVRVARLSNVYGGDFASENFLSAIIRDALKKKRILLHTSVDSAKDYVAIGDVIGILPKIAQGGQHRLYNVASGTNVSNRELLLEIQKLTGCEVAISDRAQTISFPPISIDCLQEEFRYHPSPILRDLHELVLKYKHRVDN
ncbi:MAG TPA: NAD(P)-dependent oxidoreductase [Sulfuricella sp.]|nr:NAD(P)-dependent oxidoreductase [Sulfuricella sp.]